jgi:biopolymer transport protein ExbD
VADSKGTVDVWVLETNTVYRDVPFTVVTDWIQQGRMLPEDRVRATADAPWQALGESAAFQVYFPRPQPERVEDPAEALEPVEPEFAWRPRGSEEEDDPDMIPLIDVSLVLLIFFMMTAAVSSGVLSPIKTPAAEFDLSTMSADMYWVGIDSKSPGGKVEHGPDGWPVPWYSVGKGGNAFDLVTESGLQEAQLRSLGPILEKLEKEWADTTGEVRVRLRGDEQLNTATILDVTRVLQKLEAKINERRSATAKLSVSVSGEVSEPQQ